MNQFILFDAEYRKAHRPHVLTNIMLLMTFIAVGCDGGSHSIAQNASSTSASNNGASTSALLDNMKALKACAAAVPRIQKSCQGLSFSVSESTCTASKGSSVALAVYQIDLLQPGLFIRFGDAGPQWFIREDEVLLATNGSASSFCPQLSTVAWYVGHQQRLRAPERGSSVKTYEGVYSSSGNFLHNDCSQFEITKARIIRKVLWASRSHGTPETIAMKRAAKEAELPIKLAEGIYLKTLTQCTEAVNME